MDDIEKKEMFARAYRFHVVEDNDAEAKQVCEQILREDPNDLFSRMLLAIIQADSDSREERMFGRENFILALHSCNNKKEIAGGWLEENPLYHLALWEKYDGNIMSALVYFAIDYITFGTDASLAELNEILASQNINHHDLDRVLKKVSSWCGGEEKETGL